MRFGVFGLGNKQYEHFNAVGKKIHKTMEALGASPICRRGDGDDDDNIDDDFEKWCGDLFAALEAAPQLLGARAAPGAENPVATYRIEVLTGGGVVSSCHTPSGSKGKKNGPLPDTHVCHPLHKSNVWTG